MKIVNLGCGRNPIPGMVNVDVVGNPDIFIDLDAPACSILNDFRKAGIPTGSVDAFVGIHFLEHIHQPIELMNALYKLVKPEGFAEFHVPYGSSDDADEDPTHVQRYFLDSWGYFTPAYYKRADYGLEANWQMRKLVLDLQAGVEVEDVSRRIRHERNIVQAMKVVLRALPLDQELPCPLVECCAYGQHREGLLLREIMAASQQPPSPSPSGDRPQDPSSSNG